jgi:hypothetical protein
MSMTSTCFCIRHACKSLTHFFAVHAGACCTQAACNSTRHTPWVAIPTLGHHAQQLTCMQQRSVLPMTSAAFRALPGSSVATNSLPSNDDLLCVPRPGPNTSSMQTHCPAWQLNSSLCRPSAPAVAACTALACLCNDWPLLLLDNSNSGSTTSSTPGVPCAEDAAPDTVASVLLLLGSSNKKSSVSISEVDSSKYARSDDSSPVESTAATSSSAMCGAGYGCPPNAPMRRPPPVMLLPAEELQGLMLQA